MPIAIPNTTLADPTAAGGWSEYAGADRLASGFFIVANNPAEVQMAVNQDGSLPQWGASVYCPPGVYPLAAGARQPIAGLRARNFVVGSAAQFFGILFYPGEAQVLARTPFDSTVAAGGGITPASGAGLIELSYAEALAPANVNAVTEATANIILAMNAITFDGATRALIECLLPRFDCPPGVLSSFWLFEDGISLGRIGGVSNNSGAVLIGEPVALWRRFTPAAGNHVYSIRASVGSGVGVMQAGPGGVGQWMPAPIRCSSVS